MERIHMNILWNRLRLLIKKRCNNNKSLKRVTDSTAAKQTRVSWVNDNVNITSKWRRDIILMLWWRFYYAMCYLGCRNACAVDQDFVIKTGWFWWHDPRWYSNIRVFDFIKDVKPRLAKPPSKSNRLIWEISQWIKYPTMHHFVT